MTRGGHRGEVGSLLRLNPGGLYALGNHRRWCGVGWAGVVWGRMGWGGMGRRAVPWRVVLWGGVEFLFQLLRCVDTLHFMPCSRDTGQLSAALADPYRTNRYVFVRAAEPAYVCSGTACSAAPSTQQQTAACGAVGLGSFRPCLSRWAPVASLFETPFVLVLCLCPSGPAVHVTCLGGRGDECSIFFRFLAPVSFLRPPLYGCQGLCFQAILPASSAVTAAVHRLRASTAGAVPPTARWIAGVAPRLPHCRGDTVADLRRWVPRCAHGSLSGHASRHGTQVPATRGAGTGAPLSAQSPPDPTPEGRSVKQKQRSVD